MFVKISKAMKLRVDVIDNCISLESERNDFLSINVSYVDNNVFGVNKQGVCAQIPWDQIPYPINSQRFAIYPIGCAHSVLLIVLLTF